MVASYFSLINITMGVDSAAAVILRSVYDLPAGLSHRLVSLPKAVLCSLWYGVHPSPKWRRRGRDDEVDTRRGEATSTWGTTMGRTFWGPT